MKLLLVIDVADDVAEAYEDFTVDYDLRGTPKDNKKANESIKFVEDCPLKPMPEKLPEVYCDSMWWGWNKILDRMIEEQIKLEDFAKGWNDCLDAITGETE